MCCVMVTLGRRTRVAGRGPTTTGWSRSDSPRQLMAYLGLVPSEHSSGSRRRQGGITLTGNRHARRMLVESAWGYRFPARQTAHLKRKAANASDGPRPLPGGHRSDYAGVIARCCRRARTLNRTTVAIAREPAGFIWDIACREMPKVARQAAS